jgi:periplasmic copper chaperone A
MTSLRRSCARTALALSVTVVLGLLAACGRTAQESADDLAADTAPIRISEARVRTPVPGQDKTAAYFTLENRSPAPFVLTRVESPRARAIEIHTIVRDGDMARMRRLAEVAVEPGATVRFAPGGLHLMIFGIVAPLEPFTATLVAADGQQFEVHFETITLGEQ